MVPAQPPPTPCILMASTASGGPTVLTSHLLSWLVVTPLAGAVLILLSARGRPARIRGVGLAISLLGLLLAVPLWVRYDPAGPPYQLIDQMAGPGTVGNLYMVGADGLTVLLVVLIELLGLLTFVTSWSAANDRTPSHEAGLLILQAAMIGVVVALDARLFAVSWAVMLTMVGVLAAQSSRAGWRPIVPAALSVAPLLAGILMIHAAAGEATGVLSFDLTKLQQVSLPADRQSWPFLALLAGFAAAAGSMAMAASHARDHALLSATALVTLPGYGLARFNLAILPQAARTFVPLLAGLAMATLLVAAVQAWRAREWHRTLTWAALGQLAVMLLGLAVIDPGALAGSLIHPVAVALAIAPLLAISRVRAPSLGFRAGGWTLTLVAIGVPGLGGFPGTAAIVRGASQAHPLWAVAAGGGLVVIAGAVVRQAWPLLRIRGAQVSPGEVRAAEAAVLAFAALTLLIALAPGPLEARLQPTMARVITRLDPGYGPMFATVPGCGGPGSSVPAPSAPAGFTAIAPCDNAATTPK